MAGNGGVVVTDDGDIRWTEIPLDVRAKRADGQRVIPCEESCGPLCTIQELCPCGFGLKLFRACREESRRVVVFAHSLQVHPPPDVVRVTASLQPVGGIGRFRSGGYSTSGKVRDALMTELKEMDHYQVRTRLVGSDYRIEAGGHFVTADQDGRNADTHTIQPGMVCERDHGDQGIDLPVSQALDRLGRVRSRGHRRNDETVWRADERLECAMYDHRQEVIGDLGYLQPDR